MVDIHYMHVFSYSERKFARSSRKEDKVDSAEIARRSKVLRDISQKKKQLFYDRFRGNRVSVLFESQKNQVWSGLTDNYIRVLYSSNKDLRNQFLTLTYSS